MCILEVEFLAFVSKPFSDLRPPKDFSEQGNMAINVLEYGNKKENKTGNTGTKAYFREQGTPKSKIYVSRTGEHKKNFFGSKGTWNPPGGPQISQLSFWPHIANFKSPRQFPV